MRGMLLYDVCDAPQTASEQPLATIAHGSLLMSERKVFKVLVMSALWMRMAIIAGDKYRALGRGFTQPADEARAGMAVARTRCTKEKAKQTKTLRWRLSLINLCSTKTLRWRLALLWLDGGNYPMLHNSASGPEIGPPGQISAGV